jgi:hypothetical protein
MGRFLGPGIQIFLTGKCLEQESVNTFSCSTCTAGLFFGSTLKVCSMYSKHTSHKQSGCIHGIAKYSYIYHLAKKKCAESAFWKRNIFCHGMLLSDHGQILQSGKNTGKWLISGYNKRVKHTPLYVLYLRLQNSSAGNSTHLFVTDHLLMETVYVPQMVPHVLIAQETKGMR